jgi:tRNA pseudouridine13 synthase
LRDVDESDFPLLQQRLATLHAFGLPNFFGPQRFGNNKNNHLLGMALVKEDWKCLIATLLAGEERHHIFASEGEYKRALDAWPFGQPAERNVLEVLVVEKSPQQACKTISRQLQKLWVNALQSHLFNALLQHRITDGTWNTLLFGDLAWKHDGGGRTFEVTKEELHSDDLLDRVDAFLLSPSGPLWGSKMRLTTGEVHEKEVEVRESFGLDDGHLETMRKFAEGVRRPLRVEVRESKATNGTDEFGEYVQLQFSLPAGSYATVVATYCVSPSPWFEKVVK